MNRPLAPRRVLALAFALGAHACAQMPPPATPQSAAAPPPSQSPAPAASQSAAPADAGAPAPAGPPVATTPAAPPPAAATPPANAAAAPPVASAGALAQMAWLRGCWHGLVNQRDFGEQWSAPAGGIMVGIGHTAMQGRTLDYQYLRLESRPDGVYYVAIAKGRKEQTFRLADVRRDEANGAQVFTFDNVASEFPQHLVYHRGAEGWLYAGIDGQISGVDRKVTYPMRHVSCETGALLGQ